MEGYCAVVTPWTAYLDGVSGWQSVRDEPFEDLDSAYEYLNLPVPELRRLEAWRSDFRFIEGAHTLPALLRAALDRFSGDADTIFVRWYFGEEVSDWTIERALFLELSNPFDELPGPRDAVIAFPRGVPWFMFSHDTEPLVYLAGTRSLIDTIERYCPRAFVRATLDDEVL